MDIDKPLIGTPVVYGFVMIGMVVKLKDFVLIFCVREAPLAEWNGWTS